MQRETNDPKPLSGRREFLKSAGGAAAGFYLAGANALAGAPQAPVLAKRETLALGGGPKAVGSQSDLEEGRHLSERAGL